MGAPANHAGQAFELELAFSEALEESFSYVTIGEVLETTYGTLTSTRRKTAGQNRE